MSGKKLKIIAIAVMLIAALALGVKNFAAYLEANRRPELEADVQPYLVFADGTLFIYNETYYRGENPTDDEILGTIDTFIGANEIPTENGQTNILECVGQPYTVRDGKLIIRRGKQLERPVQNADGSWHTEYYYIWYVCEPG